MMRTPSRPIVLAAGLAVMMHLLLFAAVRPADDVRLGGMPVPPKTTYLFSEASQQPVLGNEVRMVKSPVMFSLPSKLGFSRELLENDVATPLNTRSRPRQSESFLQADIAAQTKADPSILNELMLTTGDASAPALPVEIFQSLEKRPAARRVNLAPELKERLVGGIILPPELNVELSSAWEVRASVSVSEQGMVKHVFLDQPLEPAPLNQQLLQLLYSLRFKPGEGIDGSIEIYSPEPVSGEEVAP
jgi:hypothetical protein